MGRGQRTDRVAEEFREVLAEEILKLKDPRVGFVTLTHVEVTPDLRKAIVYYTVLGEVRDHKASRAGLRSAAPRLRSVLGHSVRLRYTPELEFREDDGLAHVELVTTILRQTNETAQSERTSEPVEGTPDDED